MTRMLMAKTVDLNAYAGGAGRVEAAITVAGTEAVRDVK